MAWLIVYIRLSVDVPHKSAITIYGPTVSKIGRDIGRKLRIFPTPRLYNVPAEGVPLRYLDRRMGTKTLDGKGFFKLRKSLMRSVVVSVQHKSLTHGHTDER